MGVYAEGRRASVAGEGLRKSLKSREGRPFTRIVALRSITQPALAGITAEAQRFERTAAEITRLAGAQSAAETAETVHISPEARRASEDSGNSLGGSLAGAMVDLRVAKYAFMANLQALKTGAEVEAQAAELLQSR
jgi:hypothetical protein